jgi:UDP-2-acetamido-3-amino-2,3-dideoxy-glucuronate N-acetyltransferase
MPESTPHVAVIGTGYWGKNLVRNFYNLGALNIICDKDQSILKRYREDYPGVRGVLSLSDILGDSEINGVVVATPAETHGAIVREALLAGKDVFVEKPICLSVEEGRRLKELADERSRILMIGHLLWYHPAVNRLKQLIVDGELGRILYIYSNRLNLGKLRREENVLWSFAPHDISLVLGLLAEFPEKVQAQGGNYLHHEIADTTVSMLSFPSGVRAHLFVSWLHPFKEQKLVVVGQKKMAVFDDTAPWPEKLKIYAHVVEWPGNIPVAHKADAECVPVAEAEPLKLECAHFLDSIRTRRQPRTNGEEAVNVLRVLKACQEALEKGETVTFTTTEQEAVAVKAPDYFVHETAVVDKGAEIGPGCKIWHFSHIMAGARLGERVNVGQNVVISPNTVVGNGCKIQNNVSIYEGVTLEDDVFCGPSMVFTNVHNPRSHIRRMSELRPTRVQRGATIGANATIVCGHTLGQFCFIGAGAVVTRDVPAYALVAGNPAQHKGWMCACGVQLYDDLTCPSCGSAYRRDGDGLELITD